MTIQKVLYIFWSVVIVGMLSAWLVIPTCACGPQKSPLERIIEKIRGEETVKAASLSEVNPEPPASQAQVRVTYVTESKGFKHGVLPESEKIMQSIGAQNGFDVTISQESAKVITAENLKNVDVLIFYTTGELPWSDEQKKLFLDFVRNGKGFIGIHSATDTFYKWPEYGELIGGYFDGHPWNANDKVVVQKVDKKFAVTKHWDDLFTWVEETYQYKNFNFKANKVLMSLDAQPTKMDMTKKGIRGIHAGNQTVGDQANIKPDSFPLVWYRTYGKGRVFYSEPGHNSSVWNNPKYQTMIANAIKWAAKKMK